MAGANRFDNIITNTVTGSEAIDKMIASNDRLATSLDGLGQKATKVNEHPGFSAFADKVKQGIQNPLQAAGDMAEGFLTKLGPVGAGVAAAVAVFGAFGKVSMDAARDLGTLGDGIEDTASRMGLTTRETQVFGLAMKMVGGDMGSLEGTMRKLSAEIEDGGKNLQRLGVNFRDTTTGGVLPMSSVLLQLAERLKQIPSVTERNTAAIKILGRSALQVLPDLLALPDALERAGRSGLVFTDQTLKGFSKLQEEMALVDAKWDFMVAKMKEGVTIPLMWVFGGDIDKAPKGTFGSGNFQLSFPGGKYAGASPEFRAKAEAADREAAERGNAAAKADAELDERVRAHVRALNEQRKAWFELREEIDKFAKSVDDKALNPIERLFAQRDELLKKGGGRSELTGIALRGALPELAKMRAADKEASGIFGKASEADEKRYLDWAKEQIEGLDRGSAAIVKNFLDWRKATEQVADALNDIETNSGRQEIMARSGRTFGLMSARMGPGQEGNVIEATFAERKRLAKELYDFEWSHAKTFIDQEKAFADWKRAKNDAEIEHEVRLAELQRSRIEEFRGEMGGLFDALMGGKQGLQQFAFGQIKNVARAGFANTLTSLATGSPITRQSTFAGAGLLGDMLGGQSNPLKTATDINTTATMENTAALRALAMSPTGGGGGFAGGGSAFGGLFAGGSSDAHPDSYLGGGDWGDGTILPMRNGGFNWGRAAGIAGAGAGAGFGIYSGARMGGGRGALTAAGSALAGAGAIMALANKALAWAGPAGMIAGMGLGMLTSFLPDRKEQRRKELESDRQSRAYSAPSGVDYESDIYGRGYDRDYTGRMRPIVVNINAMDARSFDQWGKENPGAIASVVSNAIMNDEQIPATLNQVMA